MSNKRKSNLLIVMAITLWIVGIAFGYRFYARGVAFDEWLVRYAEELMPGFRLSEDVMGEPFKVADTVGLYPANLIPYGENRDKLSAKDILLHASSYNQTDGLRASRLYLRTGSVIDETYTKIDFPGCMTSDCASVIEQLVFAPADRETWYKWTQGKGASVKLGEGSYLGCVSKVVEIIPWRLRAAYCLALLCCEVKDFVERLIEGFPAIDLAHLDLARCHQCPEQHW
ncbi:MAG: hypothetical protein OXC60_08120, partial [Litoreibacter sp.]|nr:hypothetical protein [Litoreibacter sp.]